MVEDTIEIDFAVELLEFEGYLEILNKLDSNNNDTELSKSEKIQIQLLLNKIKNRVKAKAVSINSLSDNFFSLIERYSL